MVFTDGVLLSADSVGELHGFAEKVGVDRLCFSHGGLGGHYVLNSPRIVDLVVEAGAEVVGRPEFCEKCLASYPRG